MKKKIIITLSSFAFVLVLVFLGLAISNHNKASADTLDEAEKRIENALGDEYKKQTKTELVGTLKYSDKEGNEINYHILKTTYYEADPNEMTGLNIDAISLLFNPDSAKNCEEMMIKEWQAARYEFDGVSYLCWTDSPEASYVLEYNPEVIPDSEILKMAESAEKAEQ